jgi:hypothetical protein
MATTVARAEPPPPNPVRRVGGVPPSAEEAFDLVSTSNPGEFPYPDGERGPPTTRHDTTPSRPDGAIQPVLLSQALAHQPVESPGWVVCQGRLLDDGSGVTVHGRRPNLMATQPKASPRPLWGARQGL